MARNSQAFSVKVPEVFAQELELSLWDMDIMSKQDYLLGILADALDVDEKLLPLGYSAI